MIYKVGDWKNFTSFKYRSRRYSMENAKTMYACKLFGYHTTNNLWLQIIVYDKMHSYAKMSIGG
jgi:hypothetical protein